MYLLGKGKDLVNQCRAIVNNILTYRSESKCESPDCSSIESCPSICFMYCTPCMERMRHVKVN